MEYVFWFAIFLVFYSYAIYPIVLLILVNTVIRKDCVFGEYYDNTAWPDIAIIIAAHNEEIDIINRINNLASLEYPPDKITIYIGSDGSTDATNTLIENNCLRNLKFFPYLERRGKASVLNDLCEKANEDIFIFSDANTLFDSVAVKELVRPFKDDTIGCVCGELEIHSLKDNVNHDGFYWKYEKYLKINENKIGGLLGANGAIYAIRNELFKPISSDTIIDDFMIAMNVVLQGYRLVYQPNAIAHEYSPDSINNEFKRRVRIGIGNYQAFFRFPKFLWPTTSIPHFVTYLSHKVLRWFTPHILLLCLFISILLADKLFFMVLLIIQLSVYLLSAIAIKYSLINKLPKFISLMVFFVSMNTALLTGFFKYISSNVNPAWERTSR